MKTQQSFYYYCKTSFELYIIELLISTIEPGYRDEGGCTSEPYISKKRTVEVWKHELLMELMEKSRSYIPPAIFFWAFNHSWISLPPSMAPFSPHTPFQACQFAMECIFSLSISNYYLTYFSGFIMPQTLGLILAHTAAESNLILYF